MHVVITITESVCKSQYDQCSTSDHHDSDLSTIVEGRCHVPGCVLLQLFLSKNKIGARTNKQIYILKNNQIKGPLIALYSIH